MGFHLIPNLCKCMSLIQVDNKTFSPMFHIVKPIFFPCCLLVPCHMLVLFKYDHDLKAIESSNLETQFFLCATVFMTVLNSSLSIDAIGKYLACRIH